MLREFWSEFATKASWEKLQALSQEFNFILIGGWAVYLWTNAHKSRDIDIVIDYAVLSQISKKYKVEKNERLKKYEIKTEQFDIDIYVSHFSKLPLPVEELFAYTTKIKGIMVVASEALLILKQGAELNRRGNVKGRKDMIDILTLLIYSQFDLKKYRGLLKKYGLEKLEGVLTEEIALFSKSDLPYVGMNEHSFSRWKKEFVKKLKEAPV